MMADQHEFDVTIKATLIVRGRVRAPTAEDAEKKLYLGAVDPENEGTLVVSLCDDLGGVPVRYSHLSYDDNDTTTKCVK